MIERADSPRTLLILLGASQFPKAQLESSSSFANSARDFSNYVRSPRGLAVPDEHVLDLFDSELSPADLDEHIGNFLRERRRTAHQQGNQVSDLLVYYVGHGDFGPDGRDYFLAQRSTREGQELFTSYPTRALANTLRSHAGGLRQYIILDACFSASAYQSFQGGPLSVARERLNSELPDRGTALLCACGPREPARAPKNLRCTMFTGALLEILESGSSLHDEYLTLEEIGDLTSQRIRELYADLAVRPQISAPSQFKGSVAKIPLFPNRSVRAMQPPRQEEVNTPERVEPPPYPAAVSTSDSGGDTRVDLKSFERRLRQTSVELDRSLRRHPARVEQWDNRRVLALRATAGSAILLSLSGATFHEIRGHAGPTLALIAAFAVVVVTIGVLLSSGLMQRWFREPWLQNRRLATDLENSFAGRIEGVEKLLATVHSWSTLRSVDALTSLATFMRETLLETKKRLALSIADKIRLEKQLQELASSAAEWERRVNLASRAADAALVEDAKARVHEVSSQHARLLKHLERSTKFVNAEKGRLRTLDNACTEVATLARLIAEEISRAGTTTHADVLALQLFAEAEKWSWNLRRSGSEE